MRSTFTNWVNLFRALRRRPRHGAARGEKRYCRALRTEALETRVLLAGGGLGGQDDPLAAAALVAQEDPAAEQLPPLPLVSVRDVAVVEGAEAVFSVVLSAPSDQPISVRYRTGNGTAELSDGDYERREGRVVFEPGQTIRQLVVPTGDDDRGEGDEHFWLFLTNPQNAQLGKRIGVGTIIDNDRAPGIDVSSHTVTAGQTAEFIVSLSNPYTERVTVVAAATADTATAGKDFEPVRVTLVFEPGQTMQRVSVPTYPNPSARGPREFTLTLSEPANASLRTAEGTCTIVSKKYARPLAESKSPPSSELRNLLRGDDEMLLRSGGPTTVNVAGDSDTEGNTLSFSVWLTDSTTQSVSIYWYAAPGTATGEDYSPSGGMIVIPQGETTGLIEIEALTDSYYEGDEHFSISLTNIVGASAGTTVATGTIFDGNTPPTLYIEDGWANEIDGTVSFHLYLSSPYHTGIGFDWWTADGSAEAAEEDYTAVTEGLGWISQDMVDAWIAVEVHADGVPDEGTEDFSVLASYTTGTFSFAATATGTIYDTPTLSISGSSAYEYDETITFTLSLSNPCQQDQYITLEARGGTASYGDDYYGPMSSVSFSAGSTDATASFTVVDDSTYEHDEDFSVHVSGYHASISCAQTYAVGTIQDDDSMPMIYFGATSFSVSEGSEGEETATFTIYFSGLTEVSATVRYQTQDGTAEAGENKDYLGKSGTLTFGLQTTSYLTSQTVEVIIMDDSKYERDESFYLVLFDPQESQFGESTYGPSEISATCIIEDNDGVDLDVDSNNDSETGTPDYGDEEEKLEDSQPGKYIAVSARREADPSASISAVLQPFIPMGITFDSDDDPASVWLQFSFKGDYDVLTLWRTNGETAPNSADVKSGGDSISFGGTYTAAELFRLNEFEGSRHVLYVEALKTGVVTVELDVSVGSSDNLEFVDSVVFNAIDTNVSPLPCGFGTEIDSSGYAVTCRSDVPGDSGDPQLFFTGNAYAIIQNGEIRLYDRIVGESQPVARREHQGTLRWEESAGQFVETRDGTEYTFQGPAGAAAGMKMLEGGGGMLLEQEPEAAAGQLISISPPGAGQVTRTFTEEGRVATETTIIGTDGEHPGERIVAYEYYDDPESPIYGHLEQVIVTIEKYGEDPQNVRKATYDYYEDEDPNGNEGDLKLVTVFGWNEQTEDYDIVLEYKYYRYYVGDYQAGSNPGYPHALKLVLTGASVDRAIGALQGVDTVEDLDGVSDTALKPFADDYFEYDAQERVSKWWTQGGGCSLCDGLGAITYSYGTNVGVSEGVNVWRRWKQEAYDDGSYERVYYNHHGQVLLRDQSDGTNHWITYHRYDDFGNRVLTAHPSAVTGYNAAYGDLINFGGGQNSYLRQDAGLIEVSEYYSETTITNDYVSEQTPNNGGVAGWFRRSGVKNGTGGEVSWRTEVDYVQKTTPTSGRVAYFTYSVTQYPHVDDPATQGHNENLDDPQTTTYAYTFFDYEEGVVEGPLVHVRETIQQAVSTEKHGSGEPTSSFAVYDTFGRLVWTKDAARSISYTEYDPTTGAVVKTIADVDLTREDFDDTFLPGDWETPADGGAHLVTTMESDALGRTTTVVEPTGCITHTVYLESANGTETRTYRGWYDAGNGHYFTTGPVEVYRQDRAGNYTESLTYHWTDEDGLPVDANGRPTGAEELTDEYAVIQSLSRSLLNDVGQMTLSRQYFALPIDPLGLVNGYSADRELGDLGEHYLETEYTYDPLGRLAVVHSPDGAARHTFFDTLGRAIAVWTGTDDVPDDDYDGISGPGPNPDLRDFRWYVARYGTAPTGTSMFLVSMNEYDHGGVGDGNLTASYAYFDDPHPSEPSPFFGSSGRVTTDFAGSTGRARAVAVQDDGKIVVGGYAYTSGSYNFALLRYNADGTLDADFGTGGVVTTNFHGSTDYGHALAIDASGRIVVAGVARNGSNDNFALARYTADGTLDSTFGTGGKVTTDFHSSTDTAYSIALQDDGKILVAGVARQSSNYNFALARFSAGGTLDSTFGTNGKVTLDFSSGTDYAYSIAVQADDKIVVAGYAYQSGYGAGGQNFALARYNDNGTLDSTFDGDSGVGNGKVTTDFHGSTDGVHSVAVQADGKIIAAGYAYNYYYGRGQDFALARYNTDGTLDTSFGTGGKVTTDFGGPTDYAHSVQILADGKILVAGYATIGGGVNFALARYNADGTLDSTFGPSGTGKLTTDFAGATDRAYAMAVQDDGKIVLAGDRYVSTSGAYHFALARYTADGQPDVLAYNIPADNAYVTQYQYDWRGRLTDVLSPGDVVQHTEYDNLGRTVLAETYASDDFTLDPAELRARSETLYDERGRVFESRVYEVEPDTSATHGAVGDFLPSYVWYDPRGMVVKTQTGAGAFQKTLYDALGRVVATYLGYDPDGEGGENQDGLYDEYGRFDPASRDDDVVIEQTQTWYDATGRAVASATFQRFPGDDTTEGPLDATTAYAAASVWWYDTAGRVTHTAYFGREDDDSPIDPGARFFFDTDGSLIDAGADRIPDVAEGEPFEPVGSLDYIVSQTVYEPAILASGPVLRTIDNAGRIDEVRYDLLGRTLRTVQNVHGEGIPLWHEPDRNLTVEFTYAAGGQLVAQTAVNPVRGDFNGDGFIDAADIDLLYAEVNAAIAAGQNYVLNPLYDVNRDGLVNQQDVTTLVEDILGTFYGDADLDGHVGITDLGALSTNWGLSGVGWAGGDFDGNGVVGASDLAYYSANDGKSNPDFNPPTAFQTTTYIYDSPYNPSWQTAVVFPDSTDSLDLDPATGLWSVVAGDDHVSTQHDRLGRTLSQTDQRGVAHLYLYDSAGRLHADVADLDGLLPGQHCDDSVLAVVTAYDDTGRVQSVTSRGGPDQDEDGLPDDVVNQVAYRYDGWGNLAQEWQAHHGEVDNDGQGDDSPSVEYIYSDGLNPASADNPAPHVRLAQVVYPNGRTLHYAYGAAGEASDRLGRLETIHDDDNGSPAQDPLVQYAYLGAGTPTEEYFPESAVRLNYDPEGDHSLTGFDRFGRVVDQLWEQYDPSAEEWLPIDRYHYGYDPAGNRVWKMNAVAHDQSLPLDELYEYDELARLVAARRGLLSTSPSLSLASVGFEQAWGLDGLGNFSTFQEDSDGQGWDLDQERDVNAANEITGIDEGQYQDAWLDPQYDAAGNMIVGPAPGDETARLHFVYDAWNRLVKVYADDAQNPGEPGDIVAQYTYDGQKRRIEKALADGTSIESYYNANWQLLEERFLDESQEPTGADQYVWSPRYIDSPVLRDRYDDEGELDAAARLYYLGDANFNVTALVGLEEVDPDVFEWQVTERYAYDPYGKATVLDADWANPAAPTTDGPLYAGYRFDPETGLYIARNRLYHSTIATWTTRDPLGYAAGDVNLYRYVRNTPAVLLDPSGLRDCYCKGHIAPTIPSFANTLNAYINGEIAAALTAATTAGTVNMTAFRQDVWNRLAADAAPGRGRPVATRVENWIETQIGRGMVFRGSSKPNLGIIKTADCFNLTCGGSTYTIGSDKIGHLFQQGYMLHEIQTTPGLGRDHALAFAMWTEGFQWRAIEAELQKFNLYVDPGRIKSWLNSGTFTFAGFTNTSVASYAGKWGNTVGTNVPVISQTSMPDVRADVGGARFWSELMNGQINGTTSPFDICKYVTAGWEE